MTDKQTVWLHIAALIAITTFAYIGVRNHHFVWDTIPFVLENPWIHELTAENLRSIFTEAHRANWHPVVLLSHAFDFAVFGNDSGKHHLMNLLLHVINCLLLYWLIDNIMRLFAGSAEQSRWVAFITALIFAIHPQHVESVAWVVERKDVLYTLFALASLLSYLKAKSSDSPRWVDELWPFMFFCLSIAAKPMAVTLPVIMLLLDIAPLKRATSLPALLKLVLEKLHYFVITIIVILVTLTTQSIAMPDTGSLPVWARALNAIDNSWFYLQHYLWPVNLSPFYPYPQDASYLSSWQFWLPGTIFLVITSVVTMALLSRKIVWPFVLFSFYIVTLLPVSGLIHVGPAKATDHYVYLATLPLTLLTALIIVSAWYRSGIARIIATVFSTVYLVFLLLITQVQVSVWNNPLSLWTRVTSLYPADPFGHRNLAAAYVQVGDWEKALMHAELSLRFGSPDKEYVTRLREEIDRINTDTGIEEK